MRMVEVTLEDGSVIPVRYPRVPPAPRIGARRRRQIAHEWLVSLSQAPTRERVDELAPLAGRFPPRTPLGRIASQFVAAGRPPVEDDVIAAYLHRQAIRRHRQLPATPVDDRLQARLLELIDQHWADHGCGPAWSWLGAQVGLDRHAAAAAIRGLGNAKLVIFTRRPGSLRRRLVPEEPTA